MTTQLLFVHALSPLHAGTGQGVGVIDLPIAREKATGIPYLPGSSLKGALRDRVKDKATCKAVFGPETDNASEHAGAAQFADARLVLLPVRSLAGTFAWVTSPYLLSRLARDAKNAGVKQEVPRLDPAKDGCLVSSSSKLRTSAGDKGEKVVLEDLDLTPRNDTNLESWAKWLGDNAGLENVAARLCVVHDDTMSFLLETATEVVARIKLQDDTKTVQEGGLWYEESLPAETLLVSLLLASAARDKSGKSEADVLKAVRDVLENAVQLGGKATVGRGLCHLRLAGGAS